MLSSQWLQQGSKPTTSRSYLRTQSEVNCLGDGTFNPNQPYNEIEITGTVNVTVELLFRTVFSVLWVIFFVSLTVLSYSTKWSARKQTTPHEGRLRVTALVLAVIYFGGALFYILLPSWVMFLSIPLPAWFRLIMVGVAVLGLSFVLCGYLVLGKNWASLP